MIWYVIFFRGLGDFHSHFDIVMTRGKTYQKLTSREKLIEENERKRVVITCAALLKVCTDIQWPNFWF